MWGSISFCLLIQYGYVNILFNKISNQVVFCNVLPRSRPTKEPTPPQTFWSYDTVCGTYTSWSPISIKISTISMWRHFDIIYVNTVNTNPKKWQNLFLTIKILGTSHFHQVCSKSFLEWIVKQRKVWDKNKSKTKPFYTLLFYFILFYFILFLI